MVTLVSFKAAIQPSGNNDAKQVASTFDGLVSAYAAYVTAEAAYVTQAAILATALGVLVADAGSPTQAHVTTANTAYTTLAADYATAAAAWVVVKAAIDALVTAAGGAVSVTFDTSKVTNYGILNSAFQAIIRATKETGTLGT